MTYSSIKKLAVALLGMSVSCLTFGKSLTLPKGVGMYQYSYRNLDSLNQQFDKDGYVETIGDGFSRDLKGPDFLENGSSEDLKRLAVELKKFDFAGDRSGILRSLSLGTFEVDVDVDASAQIYAVAYGFTDHMTGFFGVPVVDVKVETDMQLNGQNTSAELRRRLGDLSYEELAEGLEQAGALNVDRIKDSLYELEYEDLDQWEHQGLGDIQLGTVVAKKFGVAGAVINQPYGKWTLMLPTAYKDDPNNLIDTDLGNGYLANQFLVGHNISLFSTFYLGAELGYTVGSSYGKEVRRPDENGSSLVPRENLETIEINPGAGTSITGYFGASYGILAGEYRLVKGSREKDTLTSGDSEVYKDLLEGSAKEILYEIYSVGLTTTKLYEKGRFPIPLMLTAYKKSNIEGSNQSLDDYVEIEIASFFKIP